MFINAASTISHQPTFESGCRFSMLQPLEGLTELITPDYSAYIPAMERRRMSHVQKMSIACAVDCINQAKIDLPDAIIVGTSMGCCVNTRNFLDRIHQSNEGPLSPTSFIVSTHNTIAGQIALQFKCHGYNMTHTHNSLSFEHALLDGVLCVQEGAKNVLVGGADEEEKDLYNMPARLKNDEIHLGCGASFFVLSDSPLQMHPVELTGVAVFGLINNVSGIILEFLQSRQLDPSQIDLVLYAINKPDQYEELVMIFEERQMTDYQKITGTYFTGAAFAMHYGTALLQEGHESPFGTMEYVLICNNLIPENLGLTLLRKKKEQIETAG